MAAIKLPQDDFKIHASSGIHSGFSIWGCSIQEGMAQFVLTCNHIASDGRQKANPVG
jgi:hypothetical protein